MAKVDLGGDGTAQDAGTRTCRCGSEMVPLTVGTRLSVHKPDESSEAYWAATPLDAWTCTECGRTDLFARNPRIFRD